MAELQTHFEIVSRQTVLTSDMAYVLKQRYEFRTGQSFEVREVAE